MKTRNLAQGRWREILGMLGVPGKVLRNKHGACPFCGGGKDRYRFDDKEGHGTFYCNVCGAGDGFDFLQRWFDWSFEQAAKEVEQIYGQCKSVPPEPAKDPAPRLREIAKGARMLTGDDPVTEYLVARGIGRIPQALRWHPALDYYEEGKLIGAFPAMLGLVLSPAGNPLTWHATYIRDGRKAPVDHPKKQFKPVGRLNGAAIRLHPIQQHIGIAEGIETALAAWFLTGIPTWSVMNANGMESFVPPPGVERVSVFGDNDLSFTGQKAAYTAANRLVIRNKMLVEVRIPQTPGEDWLDVLGAGK